MLQTNVRHSYLKSEIGSLGAIPRDRVYQLFAALEAQARREAEEEGFSPHQMKITRLLDLRYPHQGYSLCVPCDAPFDERVRKAVKSDFDSLHYNVYGQNAPNEDPQIVTFRLQSEIATPRLELPDLPRTDGKTARAKKGQRSLYDTAKQRFENVSVWDRAQLLAGDRLDGPAIIEQFDSTTIALVGQTVSVDTKGTLLIEERGAA
jgi:N-methylhydantoinase A